MSATATAHTTPRLEPSLGHRRYRLYRATHGATYDALRAEGHATVVVDGWCTSYTSLCAALSSPEVAAADDGQVTLSAHRGITSGQPEHHPLHGTKYATGDDAKRAAYDAGLLAFMVYETAAQPAS